MKKQILIVVAHPDDETIGMGGTIGAHISRGDAVNIISMTDGVGARKDADDEAVTSRKRAAMKASEILEFAWFEQYSFEDNSMDKYPMLEIVKAVEEAKSRVNPDIVYSHSGADLNIDHRIVAHAVLTAFRPQPGEKCREIRLFEVASATDYGHENITGRFVPNLFVDISEGWEAKKEALAAYATEMREYPHSRSVEGIENLAKTRGNQAGLEMAEAFQIIRKIER